MSTLRLLNAQIGTSVTPSQNFTWYQPIVPDGSVRLGVGNSGATTKDMIKVSGSDIILDTPKAVATPLATDRSKLLATTDWINQIYTQSLSGNGWQKLPSGLILQWGYHGYFGEYSTVYYPIAFPNNTLSVAINTVFDNGSGAAYTWTAVSFDFSTTVLDVNTSGTQSINYIAIGY